MESCNVGLLNHGKFILSETNQVLNSVDFQSADVLIFPELFSDFVPHLLAHMGGLQSIGVLQDVSVQGEDAFLQRTEFSVHFLSLI